MTDKATGPLRGLKIVDISTVVAGPFAAGLLGDYGAEVIKVEMPGAGDSLRALAPHKDGKPLWWKVTNRNKRGVTLDLRQPDGRDLLAKLIAGADVLVENFRPGTLDGWGITRAWLQAINPRLTILRVTGFGQDGPYGDRPGFARIFEAMSGFTQICGEEDGRAAASRLSDLRRHRRPVRRVGILAALHDLARIRPARPGDRLLGAPRRCCARWSSSPIEYDQLGTVRTRSGNRSQYAAPGNVYRTRDGKWASIAASTQSIFERLCPRSTCDRVLQDARFATNPARVQNHEALDEIVGDCDRRALTLAELGETFAGHEVGFSPIYDIADVFDDPQFAARGRRSSRCRTASSARCACRAWCRAFPRRRARCAMPARPSASTTMRSTAPSGWRRRRSPG